MKNMNITNYTKKVLLGQLLADGNIEKIGKNCRLSFSFGSSYRNYAL